MINLLIPFLLSAILTFLITPLVISFAKTFRLVDDPKVRYHPAHTHHGVIPRAGGLAFFFGITVTLLVFLPTTKLIVGIILGTAILVITGLADDRRDLNPYLRLALNILAALIVVRSGASIPYITNPLSGGVISFEFLGLGHLLTIIWIVWTMNIVGWAAGVDGQMPGYVAISAVILGILSLRFSLNDPSQLWVTILAFVIAGGFVGFLPWNFYPQKIMPGYGGKTLAGFYLALLGILSFAKLGTALLVLGVPMTDALYTLLRRLGSGQSPVWADRGHLHHRLLDLGWGKRKIALFYWGVSAILGLVALTVTSRQKVFALLLLGVLVGGFLVWVNFFTQLSKPQDPDNG